MEATAAPESEAATEFSKLSKVQKLAAFLLILSTENAARLMKSLDEQELDEVSSEMVKLGTVTQQMQYEILREFTGVAVEAATAINGGRTAPRNCWKNRSDCPGLPTLSGGCRRIGPRSNPCNKLWKWTPVPFSA